MKRVVSPSAVVVDAVVGDIRLVSERGPGAQHEGVLTHGLHRLGEVDRHKPPRHLCVGLCLRVVLLTPEVAQVLGQELAAAQAAAVVVEVVVDDIGVEGVDPRVLIVLILPDRTRVFLVKHIVVIYEGIGCTGEEIEQELLNLRVEHALHLGCVVEILALRFAVGERDAELVHALGLVGERPG